MIPLRIALRGFLCYRDQQEFRFEGAALWMLSGLNGSGKSTVFDALTYALFGQHRDGKQNALELIHKDCDGLSVELDFELDGRRYRAHRTLRRKKSGSPAVTQQLCRLDPEGDGRWEDVPDTSKRVDFERWIKQRLGLSYETFTSSVLLMQGQAEKLIGADKAERFQVLSAIVDLEHYERLRARADDRRRVLKAETEALQRRLGALPEVTEDALARAVLEVVEAQERSRQAEEAVERLQGLELAARHRASLQAELTELRRWWEQVHDLLRGAEAIERDAARLGELQAVLPYLETAIEHRTLLERSARTSADLAVEHESQSEDLRHRAGARAGRTELGRSQGVGRRRSAPRAGAGRPLARAVRPRDDRRSLRQQHLKRQHLEDELAKFPPDLDDLCAARKPSGTS